MDGLFGLLAVWAVIALIGNILKRAKKAAQSSQEQSAEPTEKPRPAPRKSSVWEQVDMLNSMSMMEQEDRAKPFAGEGMSAPGSIGDYKPMSVDFVTMDTDFSDMKPRYKGKAFVGTEMAGTWSRFSPGDMKRAVVMAEILSRPVSMRQSAGLFQRRRCG